MAIDEWNIPTEPIRTMQRRVSELRDGTETDIKRSSRKVDGLRSDINKLIYAINGLKFFSRCAAAL